MLHTPTQFMYAQSWASIAMLAAYKAVDNHDDTIAVSAIGAADMLGVIVTSAQSKATLLATAEGFTYTYTPEGGPTTTITNWVTLCAIPDPDDDFASAGYTWRCAEGAHKVVADALGGNWPTTTPNWA